MTSGTSAAFQSAHFPGRSSAKVFGLAALGILVAYLMLPPIGALLLGSFTDSPPGTPLHFSLESLSYAYGVPEHYTSLVNSLLYASATSTLVLAMGGFLAWLVERTDSPLRHLTDLFVLTPVLAPAVLFVTGWILLLGPKNGLINSFAVEYLGFKSAPLNIFSFWGMVWVGTLQELPVAFLWLWPSFRSMNPDLEEAGIASGAGTLTVLRRITIPLLRPAILGGWIIFFVYSLGALAVPLLIGLPSRIFLFSTEIYLATTRVPSDLNLASAYSLLLLVAMIVGVHAYRYSTREVNKFVTITGKAYRPRIVRLGRCRIATTAFGVLLLILTSGLPILVYVWNAFMPYPQAPTWKSLQLVTLKNFRGALEYGPAIRALIDSLLLGIAAGVITTVLGALIAWCVTRLREPRWLVALIDQLATLPIAMPGMIVGVSLLWFYLSMPVPIYGTIWPLLIAYVTLHLPYAVRICASSLKQVHQELEEAAQVCGASWLTTYRRIVLMILAPSLVTSLLYVGLRSFREYSASIFLTAPGSEVFSVLVLDMWDGGNFSILAAYVTMVTVFLGGVIALMSWMARRVGVEVLQK